MDNNKKILVTGGAGYIGSIVVRQLLAKNYKVVVLDRFIFGIDSLKELLNNPNLSIINGDIRHIEDVVAATKGVYAVIHLAAMVGDDACQLDEDATLQINFEATRLLIEVCNQRKIKRFLFASTCSVYGLSDKIMAENSKDLNPASLYARTKLDSEKIVLNVNDMVTTVLRLSTVYGLSPRMRFDLVVNILSAKASVDKEIQIFGGKQWRPLINVEDVARAFVTVLEADELTVDKQIFNIGSNSQNFQIYQLGEKIKAFMSDVKIDSFKDDVDIRDYRVNFDKFNNLFNFKLTKTVDDSISEIQNVVLVGKIPNYKDDKYYNGRYINYKNPNLYYKLLERNSLF